MQIHACAYACAKVLCKQNIRDLLGIFYSVDNEHENKGSQCSSVLTYTLVVHSIALDRLDGAQDTFCTFCMLIVNFLWCTMQCCQSQFLVGFVEPTFYHHSINLIDILTGCSDLNSSMLMICAREMSSILPFT